MEKGRLKQKSHFQTTSLYHSVKSLTLKRRNLKRTIYRKPFASSHFSKSSTLILPPFSSKSSLLTCLPLLYFAKTEIRRVCIVLSAAVHMLRYPPCRRPSETV